MPKHAYYHISNQHNFVVFKATVPSTQSQIILASICTAQYAAKYVARSFWPELVRGNSTPSGGVLPISDSTVRYGTVPYDTVLYGTVLYCVNQ